MPTTAITASGSPGGTAICWPDVTPLVQLKVRPAGQGCGSSMDRAWSGSPIAALLRGSRGVTPIQHRRRRTQGGSCAHRPSASLWAATAPRTCLAQVTSATHSVYPAPVQPGRTSSGVEDLPGLVCRSPVREARSRDLRRSATRGPGSSRFSASHSSHRMGQTRPAPPTPTASETASGHVRSHLANLPFASTRPSCTSALSRALGAPVTSAARVSPVPSVANGGRSSLGKIPR